MSYSMRCPFCDDESTLDVEPIRTSEVIRLHERMIDHLRRKHRRQSVSNLGLLAGSDSGEGKA